MTTATGSETVDVLYGTTGLTVALPPGAQATVIRKRPMAKLPDPQRAVRDALARPVAAPPLDQLARGKESACILICDITRPVPNHLFLRPLIERMIAAGMPRERITVLVATGLHRPNEGAELRSAGRRPLGDAERARREPLRARRRRARRPRRHAEARARR